MNWIIDVQNRIKRKNQILFTRDCEALVDLQALIKEQTHRTMILWAIDFAGQAVDIMKERYPDEKRLETALMITKQWAAGKVKMPVAKRAILQAHAVAKEIDSPEDIALCHAIGQACSVIHTTGHALGFPIYELTAIIRHYGLIDGEAIVEKRIQQYINQIYYWQKK